MLLSALTVTVIAGGACAPTPVAPAADTLRSSYAAGVTFREYLPEASLTNELRVDGLELRLIGSEGNQDLMEPYRTPDDRTATPTVLLLDREFALAGCWVEQPRALQEWWLGAARELSPRERMTQKMAWYEEDAGRETLSDIASMLEEAVREGLRCP